jgi:hypothetical protein
LERATTPYVQLCGRFVVSSAAAASSSASPAGRVACSSRTSCSNGRAQSGAGELIEAIWAGDLPANRASALTVLLSKLRAAVGADVLAGRGSVYVVLAPDARVDVEQALAALHRAESPSYKATGRAPGAPPSARGT